jgi:hypothetical protein
MRAGGDFEFHTAVIDWLCEQSSRLDRTVLATDQIRGAPRLSGRPLAE